MHIKGQSIELKSTGCIFSGVDDFLHDPVDHPERRVRAGSGVRSTRGPHILIHWDTQRLHNSICDTHHRCTYGKYVILKYQVHMGLTYSSIGHSVPL